MKKLVLKTAVITVAAVILTVAAAYFCIAVFSPRTLADAWAGAGNYSLSVKYYEKNYGKTNKIADLALLCDALDEEKDAVRAAEHLKTLTENAGFADYCASEDANGGYAVSAYEYYYGKYAVAVYYSGGINAAIEVAVAAVANGYTENNAFHVLLLGVKLLSPSDRAAIAAAIEGIKDGLTGAAQGFADNDIALANGTE